MSTVNIITRGLILTSNPVDSSSCSNPPVKPGDRVMVLPNIPEDEAASLFPAGVYKKELPSGKKYLRYTTQP